MTDKELFKIDLYQRLPYDCKVSIAAGGIDGLQWNDETLNSYLMYEIENEDAWDYIKPYLRPLSSMTDKEKEEMKKILSPYGTAIFDKEGIHIPMTHTGDFVPYNFMNNVIKWLLKKQFDINGLIDMDLAIPINNDII